MMEVVSESSRYVKYTTIVREFGPYEVHEEFTNGKLVDQYWTVDGGFKKSHPDAYEPQRMQFAYYDDTSWLDTDECINMQGIYDVIPQPELITDWDDFKGFDHVLCVWIGMDGNVYQINSPDPIPMWRRKDYIGGITARNFKSLTAVAEELRKFEFIRNVEIIDIPHYNGGGKAVEFEYRLPYKIMEWADRIEHPDVAAALEPYWTDDYDEC